MDDKKLNIFFIISSALALVCAVYTFYITVFNQIISQNQGYFYALIFGFILLILFVICNLFTKLIAISVNKQESRYVRLAVLGVLLCFAVIFIISRLRYSTSISPNEYSCYKAAVALSEGTYSQNHDLVNDAMINPGFYLYSLLLAPIVSIFGESVSTVLWLNAVFYILCGYLVYEITRRFTDRVCGAFAAALVLLMPSQTFGVYSFSSDSVVTAIILGCFLLYVILFLDNNETGSKVYTILALILTGVLLLAEPILVIVYILVTVCAFVFKRPRCFNMLLALVGGVVLFALLCFAKSVHMDVDFGEVVEKEASSFNPVYNQTSGMSEEFSSIFAEFNSDIATTEENISENYFFIVDSDGVNVYTELNASWIIVLNQIIYMFMLVMTISCIILSFKEKKQESSILYLLVFGGFMMMLFTQNREGHEYAFVEMLIIASAVGIHYLYLDHHPEQKVNLSALDALEKTGRKEIAKAARSSIQAAISMDEEEFVKRAEALIFIGKDEDLYLEIKSEEHTKAMITDGHANVFDETFDDYDDDFFLDEEDDSAEPVKVTSVAPSGTTESINEDAYEVNANMHAAAKLNKNNVPAWKMRKDDYEDDDFFDEEDDGDYYDDTEVGETDIYPKSDDSESRKKILSVNVGVTTGEPEPEVTTIKRSQRGKTVGAGLGTTVKGVKTDMAFKTGKTEKTVKPVKADKPSKSSNDKNTKAVSTAINTMNNGTAVRRVKGVGSKRAVPKNIAVMSKESSKDSSQEEEGRYIPNPLPLPKKKEHKSMDYDFDVRDDDEDWDDN